MVGAEQPAPAHRPPVVADVAAEVAEVGAVFECERAFGRFQPVASRRAQLVLPIYNFIDGAVQQIRDQVGTGRTICALGDAAAWPVQGMLKHYRSEFEYHIEHKRCLV